VERPDVRPHEPHWLLTRTDDLLAIAESDLQAEAEGRAAMVDEEEDAIRATIAPGRISSNWPSGPRDERGS
jgi:hypothetical protein